MDTKELIKQWIKDRKEKDKYKTLFDHVKVSVNTWYETTDENKKVNEKKLYSSLIDFLEYIEETYDEIIKEEEK